MHCKLHEYLRQAAFLSLRLRKTKVAQHRHILLSSTYKCNFLGADNKQ